MKFEIWIKEPFLRDVEFEHRAKELFKIMHGYLAYRNIDQTDQQKNNLVKFIIEEIKNLPFLKSYTIRWALNQFTDPTNHNVSAAVVLAMIKKGYSHEAHKEILKKWELSEPKNRIPEMSEAQKEELNAKARLDSWNVCVDQVANSNVDFSNPNWRNASYYLSKELAYTLTDELRRDFNDLAIKTIKKELKTVTRDVNASKEERSKATILLGDIISSNFEDQELQAKIDSLRQKLVVRNYIELNLI